jgi:hypothetical protein
MTKKSEQRKTPVKFSMKLAKDICEKLADGFDVTIHDIITDDHDKPIDDMPTEQCIYRWIRKYPSFRKLYDEARMIQAHAGNDFIVLANRRLRDGCFGDDRAEVTAVTNYIKNLQYIEERKFWRYNVQKRLNSMEGQLGLGEGVVKNA